jgi:hypothetical protein
MRTFDNLIGNTEAYVNGVDVAGPFRRLKKFARTGTRLAKRGTKLAVLTANPHAMTMKAAKLTGKVVAVATFLRGKQAQMVVVRKAWSPLACVLQWFERELDDLNRKAIALALVQILDLIEQRRWHVDSADMLGDQRQDPAIGGAVVDEDVRVQNQQSIIDAGHAVTRPTQKPASAFRRG